MKFISFLNIELSSKENEYSYTNDWFKKLDEINEVQFADLFRMSRECFNKMELKIKNYKNILELNKKLIIFVYYLAHNSPYRVMRELFGLPSTNIFLIVTELSTIVAKLCHRDVLFPNINEYEELRRGLMGDYGGLKGILAIDGTHVHIQKPKISSWEYYNRKGVFSVNFIVLCDYKKRFRGVCYSFGSWHDARIYRNSSMRNKIERMGEYCVLGDPAFVKFRNIKSSYSTSSQPLTSNEIYELGRRRVIIENAFALLKNKFKILTKRIINGETKKGINLIKSCIWIHNFIIDNSN